LRSGTGRDRAELALRSVTRAGAFAARVDAFVDALRQRYGPDVVGAYLGGCDDGSVAP
jgi:hypothetical protein